MKTSRRVITPQHDHDQSKRMIGGAILAAGLGTRMRPLTEHTPKPMIPTLGRPLIEWGMIALAQAEIDTIGVNAYHLADQLKTELDYQRVFKEVNRVKEVVKSASAKPATLSIIEETELLGTGGGIKGIWRELSHAVQLQELICINGDALFDFPLAPLLETHRTHSELDSNASGVKDKIAGTLALRPVEPGDPFGRVGVDVQGRVVRIAEVTGPLSHTEVRVGAFTGAQVVTEAVIERIPNGFCDVFRTAHKALLQEGFELRAHFVDPQSLWLDVGNIERYLEAHRHLLDHPESDLWRYIPPHHRVHQSILFQGAQVSDSIQLGENVWIGPRSVIEGEAELHDSVVWADTEIKIEGSLSKQILTRRSAKI